jgi:GNAT superfamily N-acetyltransferase
MKFLRVDPAGDDQFMAWFNVLNRAEILRDQGRSEGWLPSEWRARAINDEAPAYHQLFSLGEDHLHPVAVGALEVTREDNLSWIRGDLFVDPVERRKGYGSTLLGHLEKTARQLERSSMLFWVVEDASESGRGPNRDFAPRHGYDVVDESIERVLSWPRPPDELERLWGQWQPFSRDYEILSWCGPTPEELLKGRAHLSAIMPVEVPDAGFELEEERWDEHRVRQHEQRVDEMGRDLLVAVAQHRLSGELVGFCELSVSRVRPETAYQWDTLVTRAHRGHRLGALMKIATMRLLASSNYPTHKIITFNSWRNEPMIAVNEALGTYVAGRIVNWRKVL